MTVGDNWREIVDPNFYVNAGWPSEWVNEMYSRHEAEQGSVLGVWHLDFLRALGASLGISVDKSIGAYSEARRLAQEIWLEILDLEKEHNEAKDA